MECTATTFRMRHPVLVAGLWPDLTPSTGAPVTVWADRHKNVPSLNMERNVVDSDALPFSGRPTDIIQRLHEHGHGDYSKHPPRRLRGLRHDR